MIEGGCTGALLLNNAQRASNDRVVNKHKRESFFLGSDVTQADHGTRSIVRVDVAVDDASEDTW